MAARHDLIHPLAALGHARCRAVAQRHRAAIARHVRNIFDPQRLAIQHEQCLVLYHHRRQDMAERRRNSSFVIRLTYVRVCRTIDSS